MKLLRNAFLLLLVAMLAFGGTGMAWGATADLVLDDATASGNVGVLDDATAPAYKAKVYYMGTSAPEVKIPVGISVTDTPFDPDEALTLTSTPLSVPAFTVTPDVSVLSSAADGSSDPVEIMLTVGSTASLTPKKITLTLTQDSDPLNTAEATLELEYIPVASPSLSVLSPGTNASMDFYVGLPATKMAVVTTAGNPSASFDLVCAANPAGSWTGPVPVVTSRDVHITTAVATPAAAKATFDVTATKIVIAGDNKAVVAGITAPISVGTLTAQISNYGMTLASTDVKLTVGAPVPAAQASIDVKVLPNWNDVASTAAGLTIATGASATDSSATYVSWNGLTISADRGQEKILITGTPAGVQTETFVVFARSSGGVVLASKDFKIDAITAPLKTLVLEPSLISGAITRIFNDSSQASVGGLNPAKVTLTDLKLEGGAYKTIVNGLTVSVDLTSKKIFVMGSPDLVQKDVLTVTGTFSDTTSADATLTINVTKPVYTLIVKPSSIPAAKGKYFTQTADVSIIGTPPVSLVGLTVDGGSTSTKNGITATVNSGNKIVFSGTPDATGKTRFAIVGTYGTFTLGVDDFTVYVTEDLSGEVIDDDPREVGIYNNKTGVTAFYNYENFIVNIPQKLYFTAKTVLSTLTITMTDPYGHTRTLVEGATRDYTVTDTMFDGMEIAVNITPDMTGDYTFTFEYLYSGTKYKQEVTLDAVKAASERSGGGGGGGCSATGSGIALLAILCLGGLSRKKRQG